MFNSSEKEQLSVKMQWACTLIRWWSFIKWLGSPKYGIATRILLCSIGICDPYLLTILANPHQKSMDNISLMRVL